MTYSELENFMLEIVELSKYKTKSEMNEMIKDIIMMIKCEKLQDD